MLEIRDKKLCCGCGVCANVCPTACIQMKEDAEGFVYPDINSLVCIQCERCDQVCPFKKENVQLPAENIKAYLVKNDDSARKISSSGGAFLLLAESCLKENGVVFGAKLENLRCVHDSAETLEDVTEFCGSKYVQSDTTKIWRSVLKQLKTGRRVLFVGTPCQVAALKRFLAKPYDNLLCVDLICHGVPSPGVFRSYCKDLEKKYGQVPQTVFFRHKEKHWQNVMDMMVKLKNETVRQNDDPFLLGFLTNLYLRPSCYDCRANGNRSGSDITLADYWGVDTIKPETEDGRGVSLLLTKTEAGERTVTVLKNNSQAVIEPASLKRALIFNQTLYHSSGMNKGRSNFFSEYSRGDYSFSELAKKYCKVQYAPKTWLAIYVKRFLGYRFYNRIWLAVFGRK